MDSPPDSRPLRRLGSPIRTSPDRSLLTAPRGSIGVRPVLLRLLAPRHPPCALISLTNFRRTWMYERRRCNMDVALLADVPLLSTYIRADAFLFLLLLRYPVFKERILPPTAVSRSRILILACFRASFNPLAQAAFTRHAKDGISYMVEPSGIEPLTPCLQGRCSPS